jgi:hypothetical protein
MSNTDPLKNPKNKQIKLGLNLCAVPTSYRVPLVEQELLTIPEHLSSPPVFSGVRVTRTLVLYLCFVDRCLFLHLDVNLYISLYGCCHVYNLL